MEDLNQMKNRFEGKAAIVTGAASGLGRALTIELALRGRWVFVGIKIVMVLKGQQEYVPIFRDIIKIK